jgi:glycosyltransferase involved in cell wall biosynthesis
LIVPPKNVSRLAKALQKLARSQELRQSMGRAARDRVVGNFDARLINEAVVGEYSQLAQRCLLRTMPLRALGQDAQGTAR